MDNDEVADCIRNLREFAEDVSGHDAGCLDSLKERREDRIVCPICWADEILKEIEEEEEER